MNKAMILILSYYKKWVSPILPSACRFHPSCSEYAMQAFREYSFFKASLLTIKRISKCNPFSKGYFDPLPEKNHNHT